MVSIKKELIGRRLVENLESVMARYQRRLGENLNADMAEEVARNETWNLVEQYDVDTRDMG